MPKVRKMHRKKSFKVNINRKNLRNKLRKLPTITCPQIKKAWQNTRSMKSNLKQMGLSYDANESVKIPNTGREMIKQAKYLSTGKLPKVAGEGGEKKKIKERKWVPRKQEVALELEADANAPRERMFRLPNGQVQFLTYLIEKHGEDYKAMARDKKNHYQLTWKQIRAKINTFKTIPEQYGKLLANKNQTTVSDDESAEST